MCGLVGVIGKYKGGLFKPHSDAITQLLYADTWRGPHSTGVFAVDRDMNCTVKKAAMPGHEFVCTNGYKKLQDKLSTDFLACIGHNRWATAGAVNDQNAHPFIGHNEGSHIILVHNGTLSNHAEIGDTDVDSHAIAQHIAENGVDKTLSELDGAFALIWYNIDEKTINWVRNDRRPLFSLETHNAYFLVSEELLGRWVIERNNMKAEKVAEVPVGDLFTFNFDTQKLSSRKVEFKKKVYRPVQYLMGRGSETATRQTQSEARDGKSTSEACSTNNDGYSLSQRFELGKEMMGALVAETGQGWGRETDYIGEDLLFEWDDYAKIGSGAGGQPTYRFSCDTGSVTINCMVTGEFNIAKCRETGKVLGTVSHLRINPSCTTVYVQYVDSPVEIVTANGYLITNEILSDDKFKMVCCGCTKMVTVYDLSDSHVNFKYTNSGVLRKSRITCPVCRVERIKNVH